MTESQKLAEEIATAFELRLKNRHWVLDGHTPCPVSDLLEWARWLETADRHVAADVVAGVRVSTIFLGLDHQWGEGPPILFETMIFEGYYDGYCSRCCTWDQAETQHAAALARVKRLRRIPRRVQHAMQSIKYHRMVWLPLRWWGRCCHRR